MVQPNLSLFSHAGGPSCHPPKMAIQHYTTESLFIICYLFARARQHTHALVDFQTILLTDLHGYGPEMDTTQATQSSLRNTQIKRRAYNAIQLDTKLFGWLEFNNAFTQTRRYRALEITPYN